jgi:predicted NBD/HSP70 family sugar kinase
MTWLDWLWELLDNALYMLHLAAVVLVGLAAIACPVFLQQIRDELAAIREEARTCQCCRHDDGPGPVLPRVLPRLRRIGEEAGE